MVGYGASLRQARRPGYESTYLNYDSLNKLLKEIEELCYARTERLSATLGFEDRAQCGDGGAVLFGDIDAKLKDLLHQFVKNLQLESEKVSLVTLTEQGQLADAVGALRFGKTAGYITPPTSAIPESSMDDDDEDLLDDVYDDDSSTEGGEAAFGRFGEEAALLPRMSNRILDRSNSLSQPKPIFGSVGRTGIIGEAQWKGDNKLDSYTALGVEVLHLLRYICVNAMGIRKLLKKHDKLLFTFGSSIPTVLEHQLAWEKTGVRRGERLPGGPDDHIQQLANSNSIAALNASLVSALAGFEQSMIALQSSGVQSIEKPLHRRTTTNPYISSEAVEETELLSLMKEGGEPPSSLLRLQCTLWSIRTLREYAQIMNEPFNTFLSRRAMIATGHSQLGGLEGATKQALDVLLRFQPDSILFMDESDLQLWQNRSFFQKSFYQGSVRNLSNLELSEESYYAWGGVSTAALTINLLSILLYTVNYYIIAPTANQYAIHLGTDSAYGATLIGASSFSALFGKNIYHFSLLFGTSIAYS